MPITRHRAVIDIRSIKVVNIFFRFLLFFLLLRNLPLDIPGLVSKFIPINFSREEIFWGDYFTFAVELNT